MRHAELEHRGRSDRAVQLVEPRVASLLGQLHRVPLRDVGQLEPHAPGGQLPDELAGVVIMTANAAERAADRD